jgi:hypothetical protein
MQCRALWHFPSRLGLQWRPQGRGMPRGGEQSQSRYQRIGPFPLLLSACAAIVNGGAKDGAR